MNATRHTDELVLRVEVSRFRDARDVLPRPARSTYRELVDLVAPARPPVRRDLVEAEARRLHMIDEAARVLTEDGAVPDRLADHPTFRALERVAWTTPGDPAERAAAVALAAEQARDNVRRRTKLDLPCWSPVRCLPGTTRGVPAVDVVTCLVLDYDDGTRLDDALAPWLDWPLVAATTWSHAEDHPRFRIILALETPVPAAAWPDVWAWAAARAVGPVDPACKDPSRLYLLPAVRGERSPYQRVDHDPGGHLLGVSGCVAQPTRDPSRASPKPSSPPVSSGRPPADAARRAARDVFRVDEGARRRAAAWLEAEVTARRAQRVTCPGCRRPSVWFWLSPGALATAQCHHRQSCGWWGHLDELLDARGGADVG
ncbi:MAG: hypothetical protein H6733_08425 [Alphaproteobacteria bacterium]|nr:hypothetical protein [Alphaproteobacteria bacterium]